MLQKQNKGIGLCRPVDTNGLPDVLQTMTGALAAGASFVWMYAECTGTRQGTEVPALLLSLANVCIAYGILRWQGQKKWFIPGVLTIVLAAVLCLRQQLLDGFCLIWNQFSYAKTLGTGWMLPELALQAAGQEMDSAGLFSVVAGVVLGTGCCLLADHLPELLGLLLPVGLLAGGILLGYTASVPLMFVIMVESLVFLSRCGWKNGKPGFSHGVGCALLAAICVGASLIPAVQDGAGEFAEQLQQKFHGWKYETQFTTLPDGKLDTFALPETQENQVGLVVTMDVPERTFLRGFTGAQLEENSWKPLNPKYIAEERQRLYWLSRNAFQPSSQFASAAAEIKQSGNTVMVKNLGACSEYRYVPYNFVGEQSIPAENLNMDGVRVDNARAYVYDTVGGGVSMVESVLEYLQNAQTPQVTAYRRAESAYREFIDQNYLDVPVEMEATLKPQWELIAAQYGGVDQLTPEQAQTCALTFLHQCFPGAETGGMELPLPHLQGSSYQIATVMAMTMRYFGIPARYAEGYEITAQMAEGAKPGDSIPLNSTHARAWAEIYQDGVGWLPLELTAGFAEDSAQMGNSNGSGSAEDTQENNEQAATLPPEGQQMENPLPETDDLAEAEPDPQFAQPENLRRQLLLWAVPLLFVLLVVICRRRIVLSKRKKKFLAENPSDGVAWIFADTANLLACLGFERGNGSVTALVEPVGLALGQDYGQELEEMVLLNHRALFSSKVLLPEHRELALQFREKTVVNLKSTVNWGRRLWLKWIRCLY